jgi:prepilin-type N-terminal cleavage/methylation domain-containing protein
MSGSERGFTLIEVLVASAILASAFVVLLRAIDDGQRIARAQPEAADLRQRVRVAADMLQRDLLMAGAGTVHGATAGPLSNYLPAVLPMRTGARRADPELSFFDDRISILYVEEGAAAAPLSIDMATPDVDVPVNPAAPGCPSAGLCGFEPGTRALIVQTADVGNGYDTFSVSGLSAGLIHGPPDPNPSQAYVRAGTQVLPVRQRVYYLDSATHRLMLYDGHQTDVALVENIVVLRFEYFGDPWPGSVPRPTGGSGNCVYGAGAPPVPLLNDYGGAAPVAVGAAQFTDGPVCGLAPNRFDGDLLRIRRVRVTIRAQASDRMVRGSGPDFVVSGLNPGGKGVVPDIEVTFDVAPRNLQASR